MSKRASMPSYGTSRMQSVEGNLLGASPSHRLSYQRVTRRIDTPFVDIVDTTPGSLCRKPICKSFRNPRISATSTTPLSLCSKHLTSA